MALHNVIGLPVRWRLNDNRVPSTPQDRPQWSASRNCFCKRIVDEATVDRVLCWVERHSSAQFASNRCECLFEVPIRSESDQCPPT